MRRRDRAMLLVLLPFAHGGGFNPTNTRATIGRSGEDSIRAVGSFPRTVASALPAGNFSFIEHCNPYLGGEYVPIVCNCKFHPASVSTEIISSANRPASRSPSLVISTVDPRYGLMAV